MSAHDKSKYEPVVLLGGYGLVAESFKRQEIKTYVKKLSTLGINTHSPKVSIVKILIFLMRFLQNIILVYRIIKRERIKLVYLNSSVQLTSALASRLAGVEIVWHVREIMPDTKAGRLLIRLINSLASDIIAISMEVKRQFDSSKTTLIYDGINLEEFKPDLEKEILFERYGLDENETVFVHAGQLFPVKGSFVYLKAAKLLVDAGCSVKFFVVGGASSNIVDGSIWCKVKRAVKSLLGYKAISWKEELEKFAKDQGIADRVIFTGWQNNIANLICLAHAVVSPHYVPEPFGLTLIEAGALKRPVISSTISPTPQIVIDGKTGVLVEPNNPERLAMAMKYIIDNPIEGRRMGENGYQNVMNNFHINATHSKIRRLCEDHLVRTDSHG